MVCLVPWCFFLLASFDNPSVCLFSSIWHMRAHAPRPIPICHLPTQASGCTLSPCASNRKCNCFSLRRPPGPSTACARCHPPPPSHTGERVPGRDSAFAGCSKQSLRIFAVPVIPLGAHASYLHKIQTLLFAEIYINR